MFERVDDQETEPKRRGRLRLWAMLTIWLVMSIGFAAYNWFLVRQDEAIATREKAALGSIYEIDHGKHDTALYTFSFAGETYHESGLVRSDQCLCNVAVYFDPTHPSTNSLVEYQRKSSQDHGIMIGCGYAAIGLVVILACALVLRRARQKQKAHDLQVSKSIT